jgi:hypothetical protein
MELFILFMAFGGFVALFLGGLYLWARRRNGQSGQQFARDTQALGFTLVAKEKHGDLREALITLPGWQDKKVQLQAAALKQVEAVKVYLLVCEQIGGRISHQFAVSLFISPDLQLPGFYLRPKRQNEKAVFAETVPQFSKDFVVEYADGAQVVAHFQAYPAQHYSDWLKNNGWSPRLRLAGSGNIFSCFCLTTGWPDKETLNRLADEGWQHMLAHQTACKQGDIR